MNNNLEEGNVVGQEQPHLSFMLNTEVDIEIKQEPPDTEADKEELSCQTVENELKKMSVENSAINVGGDFCEQVTVVDNYTDVINIKYEVDIKDEIIDGDYEDEIQMNKEIPNQNTTVDNGALKFVEVTYENDFGVESLPSQFSDRKEDIEAQNAYDNLLESIKSENIEDVNNPCIKAVCGSENSQQAIVLSSESHSNFMEMKYAVHSDIESIDINQSSQKPKENVDYEGTKWQQCLFCEHKTKTRYNLRRHIEAKHSEVVKWHQCQFCELKVKCKESLRRHIKFNHDDNTEWLYCTVCEFRTKRNFHLNKHIKTKHSEDSVEWYYCNFCDLRTRNKGNLRQHLKFKHRIINLV